MYQANLLWRVGSVIVSVILHMSVITQDGWSALMVAAQEGHTETVAELVKAGADMNLQDYVCLNIVHVFFRKCLLLYHLYMYMAGTCNFQWETDINLVVVCVYT